MGFAGYRLSAVDGFDAERRPVAFVFFWGARLGVDEVVCLQAEALDLTGGDVDIVGMARRSSGPAQEAVGFSRCR